MLSKPFAAAALALATSSVVSAQTFSSCNPMEKACPPDPALGKKTVCDFTKGKDDLFQELPGTTLSYQNDGALFSIAKDTQAPTIMSNKYLFFGKVDVVLKAAPGAGMVTSIVLQSDDLDEIDWEWIGNDNANVQTNFFSKTHSDVYTNGKTLPVSNPTGSFHTYTVEWTSNAITWSVDGKVIRSVTAQEAGKTFPQTPMQVKLGTWCGGCSKAEGTRNWAGGAPDFSKAPFNAIYKSVTLVDYAGKDSPANGGVKEYVYGDKSGNWQSIKVINGEGGESPSGSSSSAATSLTTATSVVSSVSSGSTAIVSTSASASTTVPPNNNKAGQSSAGSSNVTTGLPSSTVITKPSTTGIPTSAAARGSTTVSMALLAGVLAIMAQFL